MNSSDELLQEIKKIRPKSLETVTRQLDREVAYLSRKKCGYNRPNWIKAILNKRREPYSWTDERLRPFTRVNTETDNSRCPQTDATKQVKDNGQYSWIGKTYYHSRYWKSRPEEEEADRWRQQTGMGWTDATKKADYRMFLEAVLDPSDPFAI